MRSVLLGSALLFCILALPAQACEECNEYFNAQNYSWCWECRYANCGYYACEIREFSSWGDYCITDARNAGCYEDGYFEGCGGTCTEGDCELNPVERRLDEEWRLATVHVQRKRSPVAHRLAS